MNDTVVIDGEINLLSMIDGDPSAFVPADSLAYEEGTLEVETATNTLTVTFGLAHATAPFLFWLSDVTEVENPYGQSIVSVGWFYPFLLWGADMIPPGSRTPYKGIMTRVQQFNTTNDFSTLIVPLTSTSAVSSTGISEYINHYLRPGRTYKWIAVWR